MAATTLQYRKTRLDSFGSDCPIEPKRVCKTFHYRLASESPPESDDDTESVYSVQGRETECVKDTTDTETGSEYEVDCIEYELDSLSESNSSDYSSNGSESEDMVSAAVAAIDCFDGSNEDVFLTDAEESDNSQCDDNISSTLLDFWICIECKKQNDNPQYRLCDKCFQDRKLSLPPRPRRQKKSKRSSDTSLPSKKLNVLETYLKGFSQDSGIGSSQEFGQLNLDKVALPHLDDAASTSKEDLKRKRKISECSILSEDLEVSRPRKVKKKEGEEEKRLEIVNDAVKTEEVDSEVNKSLPELKEMCMFCNTYPKNSVFLHGRIAHMCCCYKCAMRTWKKSKRCPICNRKISNVVRVFTT